MFGDRGDPLEVTRSVACSATVESLEKAFAFAIQVLDVEGMVAPEITIEPDWENDDWDDLADCTYVVRVSGSVPRKKA